LSSTTDLIGQTTRYEYDLYGNLVRTIYPDGTGHITDFDVMNRPIHVYFRESEQTQPIRLSSIEYIVVGDGTTQVVETSYLNSTDKLSIRKTMDYAGREISVSYDGFNYAPTTTQYNANGTVASVTASNGAKVYYKYDGLNRVTEQWTQIEENGFSYTKTIYDKNSNVIETQSGVDLVALWSVPTNIIQAGAGYLKNGLKEKIFDTNGRMTQFFYDSDNRLVKTITKISPIEDRITEMVYDSCGRVVETKIHARAGDFEGNAFDNNEVIVLSSNRTFDIGGRLSSETNASGVTTRYTYDLLDRVTKVEVENIDANGNPVMVSTLRTYRWDGQLLSTTDANGNTTQNVYDARGRVIQTIDPLGGVTAQYYDNAGRVTAIVSPRHFDETKALSEMTRTEYLYDTLGRVLTVTQIYFDHRDSTWKSFVEQANAYDCMSNVTKTLDAMGYAAGTGNTIEQRIQSGYGTTYTYNLAGMVKTELDPESAARGYTYAVRYTYDALGRLTLTETAEGTLARTEYDPAGNVIRQTVQENVSAPVQTILTATYDFARNVLTQTDANGYTITNTYNALNQIRSTFMPGDSSMPGVTVYNQYNRAALVSTSWSTAGVLQTYTYDHLGHLLSLSKSEAGGDRAITKYFRYDHNGNLVYGTDGNGSVTEYTYDAMNRVIFVTQGGKTAGTTYDANGNQLTATDWLGNTVTNVYDDLNRIIEKRDAYNLAQESYFYDNSSRQVAAEDVYGRRTTYTYDRNNRLIQSIAPDGYSVTQTYDRRGNLVSTTNAIGQTSLYAFDYLGRLISVTNAIGETTYYTYDLKGNLLSQTDPSGKATLFEYNNRDLLTKRIAPGGRTGTPGAYVYDATKVISYTYDALGNNITRRDPNGNTAVFEWDIHGNLLREAIGTEEITYTYDKNGNVLSMTDALGTTTRVYDAFNRCIQKTVPFIGTGIYTYDLTPSLTPGHVAESTTDPKGNTTLREYDRSAASKASPTPREKSRSTPTTHPATAPPKPSPNPAKTAPPPQSFAPPTPMTQETASSGSKNTTSQTPPRHRS